MKYRNALRRFGARVGAAAAAVALVPSMALAQTTDIGFDTAEVIGIVDEAKAFIITVGLAVLSLIMVAKGLRWGRRAG